MRRGSRRPVAAADTRTPVLFIGGEGRSGSTVLERMLSGHAGTCALGEVRNLFERGIRGHELCGCGRFVEECDLWSEVGRRFVGGWDSAAGREVVEFFARVNRSWRLPAVVAGRGRTVDRARSQVADLYRAIGEVAGARVLVDSSKHPAWAYLLAASPSIDLRVVHLVRHPSGVAYSWAAPVVRPHAAEGTGDRVMPAHSPWEVGVRWDVFNTLFRLLERRGTPTVLVRYEDYVLDADRTLRRCLELAGLEDDGRPAALHGDHGIAGNPVRFTPSGTPIVADTRWIDELGTWRHALVSGLTWPVRPAYGYRYRRAAPVVPPGGPRSRYSALPRPPGA